MAGRGRGRGRGSSSHPGKSSAERRPKTPSTIEELKEYLLSLNEGNFDTYGEIFANMMLGFSTNEGKVKEAVSLVFETIVEDRENVSFGARVCRAIANPSNPSEQLSMTATLFLKKLLNRFQLEFDNKESTRMVSIERWLSIFSFLCEVFHCIRLKGQPISVAGRAIVTCMEWLVSQEDSDDDEVECVCSYLKTLGKDLDNISKDKVKSVVGLLRKRVVGRKSSCKSRCVILEVLEFRAMGWQDRDNELDEYYLDAITDAAVEDDLVNMKE